MRAVVVIAGDAVPDVAARRGQFADWIRERTGRAWPGDWGTHDLRTAEGDPPEADAYVITGSSSSVIEQTPWMQRAEGWIRAVVARGTPLLGLCFGHQLIGHALGGEVQKNPRGREIGTVDVTRVAADPLFERLPAVFQAQASHVDSVTRLPEGATLLASTLLEPVAAYRVGRATWAVQFHPEFDDDIVRGYLHARAHLVRAEGGDPEALLRAVRDHGHGELVLHNFARVAAGESRA